MMSWLKLVGGGNVKTHEGIFTALMDNKFNIFYISTTMIWSF